MTPPLLCSICQLPIPPEGGPSGPLWRAGHNAQPVNAGRCCGNCNHTVVLPARINLISMADLVRAAAVEASQEEAPKS